MLRSLLYMYNNNNNTHTYTHSAIDNRLPHTIFIV